MSPAAKAAARVPLTNGRAHVAFLAVNKSYGGAEPAVKDLDLEVMRGEFLTLLGPSGSGKTTALMMLAGFEQPTSGEIHIDGRRIDRVPPNKRDIGLVFQNYALFPHMTVAENLAYPLKVRRFGGRDITERVARMLELVQLPDLGGRRPDQLSGGQQQRVAVARALIFEPSLVLMDEPLGALDKQLREQMQFELKAIHDKLGGTFIYVTHDQTEALTMSDRIAVFEAGEVRQIASPTDLYERPDSSFVAGFIGENNRLPGRVAELQASGQAAVRLDSGDLIAGMAAHGVSTGDTVLVSVRPERMHILSPGQVADATLSATVKETIYVGDHLRLVARLCEQAQDVVIKIVNSDDLPPLPQDSPIRIGWRCQDGRALKP